MKKILQKNPSSTPLRRNEGSSALSSNTRRSTPVARRLSFSATNRTQTAAPSSDSSGSQRLTIESTPVISNTQLISVSNHQHTPSSTGNTRPAPTEAPETRNDSTRLDNHWYISGSRSFKIALVFSCIGLIGYICAMMSRHTTTNKTRSAHDESLEESDTAEIMNFAADEI